MRIEDEGRLIQRARQGDLSAVSELYNLHVDRIYQYVRYRTGDDQTAEDITAEVFLRAIESLGSYNDQGAPFIAWLYRIAHARIMDFWRSAQRRQTAPLDDPLLQDSLVESNDAIEVDFLQHRSLQSALLQLTDEQQTDAALRCPDQRRADVVRTAAAPGCFPGARRPGGSAGLGNRRRYSRRRNRGQPLMQAYGSGFARVYNQRWVRFAQSVAPAIREYYEICPVSQKHRSLLDLCCGTGQLARHFLEHGYDVTGIDLSEPMLEWARQNNLPFLTAVQARFILGDAASFSLKTPVGLVVSTFDALNHLPDFTALQSCFRCVWNARVQVAEEYKKRYGVNYFLKGLTGGVELRMVEVFEPTCTICGLTSGYQGPGSKTVLPARASAKVDFRLVPDQMPEKVLEQLRQHLDANGFEDVKIQYLGGEPAARTDPDDPFVALVVRTANQVYDHPMELVPMVGGSGPNYPFVNLSRLPVVTAGAGHPGSLAHAPNENIRLDLYLKHAQHMARIIQEFGD